ncbi:folate receptor [Fistulifera solaris]|uniref:Folate receptor n=1 Tax=Fistulifera solaris TaxID=1519565 RepID=A0A1Z5JHA3_FISSO|nr:folate receptor [Fistulifera solaris]|eukprot:GAX13387.1 folate receptor [Fistulifera solaris]
MKIGNYAIAVAALPSLSWGARHPTCQTFSDLYADGTELCEKMFSDAFVVVPDDQPAYHMWFFDTDNNPNDQVTRDIFGTEPVEECNVQYFHKEVPSPEGDDMGECHPWKQRSCCHSETVGSVEEMKALYGSSWDRCGTMSEACERFFVFELCFYECEPSVGLFRRFNDSQTDHPDFNTWQLYQMPMKKSYCDAWFDACKNDFFSEERFSTIKEKKEVDKLGVSLGVIGAFAFLLCLFSSFLVHRERSGKPVFVAEKANPVA